MTPSASLRDRLAVAPEVVDALAAGTGAVALESTLISHGLPYPSNVEVARAAEAAVRETGAVPATVAIRDGRLLVGLDDGVLEELATAAAGSVRKASRPTLAAALAGGGLAATTVSATMIAAHAAGIRVFATGGVGGVHRGAFGGVGGVHRGAFGGSGPTSARTSGRSTLDVSSDLEELARTPVAVVCAGPKAILDVPATIEWLETRGVPVVTIGQDEVPGFYARRSGVRSPESVGDVAGAAVLAATHLGLGLGSGLLVCVPVPAADTLDEAGASQAVERAVADADAAGVAGPELTPWLLARIAELTEGRSVRANTALIVNDARVAGQLAVALGSRSD
ncbi:MAG TPA: pseudouridine-5'-phosphate glycosidase [Candidatus Limnocylindrales bacterium]|nr:pseudouridine-5'-phosphate glycosidase [Candidatus Limnocylindrales bacterium]